MRKGYPKALRRPIMHVIVGVAVVVAALLVARPALADYSIDKVDIDATVGTDGSLEVSEERTFNFDGSYHGVYWNIPEGEYEGRTVAATVESAGEVVDGRYVAFIPSSSGLDGTYQVIDEDGSLKVKLYSAHEDESAEFVIRYRDKGLASRWSDTGELYWKFVSDGWDVESQNVTCTVHLPVPDGTTVSAGNNVRAWGHGPLDATLSFSGNDIVYSVPGVGTDEYAEARIVFPAEWLSDEQQSSTAKLDSILSEEQQWADQANAQRMRARVAVAGVCVVCTALAIASLVIAHRKRSSYRADHTPQFDDKYFRDVPTADHPAVLGALLREGTPESQDFSASLMRLCDMKVVALDEVTCAKRGMLGLGKAKKAYRLTKLSDLPATYPSVPDTTPGQVASKQAAKVDAATLRFAFDDVAAHTSKTELEDGSTLGPNELLLSDFKAYAESDAQGYSDAYDRWKDTVFAACATRGFFVDDKPNGKGVLVGLAAAGIGVGLLGLFALLSFGVTGGLAWTILFPVAACVAGGICALFAHEFKDRSREAIEVEAELEGLRNWLTDFTRLKEAVPHDVVLWNRLLVMAVVLGVADKVIEQLKVAAPEVLESDAFMPVYGWYYYGGLGARPIGAMNEALSDAHSVSTAALAKSANSSGGGFGGGFSGGGGGGFGGGGGGGAF